MNKIKLLSRLQDFFNADEKKKKEKADEIEGVIKKLKTKERKIKAMLGECQDEDMKKALQLEADIIKAQIDKGMTVLKNL
jgi:proteasome assembly chaperone (PAC2) family protein